ncbi:hypothetical protein [Arthrobacter sp. MA-N2]|uniref:hypothetical protein n=1 Tax=Arthrobacter sp. MA-N2 TaxID=1101188 RepID=UPI000486166B|nr:hypothetical protein [Arthrobacter sp. MA-N2]
MQFDFTTLDTSTYVFVGTLILGLVLAAFIAVAAMATLALVGAGSLAWYTVKNVLGGLVRGINFAWDLLVHQTGKVELPVEFPSQTSPSTGTYPRVALRDS